LKDEVDAHQNLGKTFVSRFSKAFSREHRAVSKHPLFSEQLERLVALGKLPSLITRRSCKKVFLAAIMHFHGCTRTGTISPARKHDLPFVRVLERDPPPSGAIIDAIENAGLRIVGNDIASMWRTKCTRLHHPS